MAVLLLVAGTETTVSLIGTTIWALLRHPDALARLREAPWLLPAAVEEAVRWESPVQRTWRIAKTDVELAGQRIPAGALVVLLLGAANRDPARFADPDRFDLRRRDLGHLAFGAGVHVVPRRLSRPPRDPGRGQRRSCAAGRRSGSRTIGPRGGPRRPCAASRPCR